MAQTNQTITTTSTEPRVASNRIALIAIAAMLATVTNAVAFMIPPLLPVITTSYTHDNNVAAATWVFSAMTLGGGAGFVLIPRLTDVLSDRAIALLSGTVLTGGALVAAVLDSYVGLVAGSALMGFGGAAQLVPLSFLRRHLGGKSISTAVTVGIMATGTGVVLGQVGGGLSLHVWPMPTHLDPITGAIPHQSIAPFFYILAALFVLTTIGLLVIVPNSPPEFTGRLGVFGPFWLVGWVTLVLLPLSAPQHTWLADNGLLVLLVGIALAIVWGFAERRAKTPVFDLTLLRRPFVTTACLSAGLFGCLDAAFLVLVNYYIQTPNLAGTWDASTGTGWPAHVAGYGLGHDPLKTSLLLLPFALTMFLSGKLSEKIVAQGKPGVVLVVGAAVCLVGLGFLALFHDQAWHYIVGSGIVGVGSRAGYSGAFAVPQFVVPENRAGMAAGLPGTIMAIGFALGAAIITMVQNASGFVYHSVDAAHLAALAANPAQSQQLTQSLNSLDLRTSDYLLEGTHFPLADAYTQGYLISMLFPALVVVAVVVSRLRNPRGFQLTLKESA